jgi:hypothetical protein
MSNKERLSPEECQIRKDTHLDRTIKEIGYEEISQNEYRRLKKNDPSVVNGYTIRFRFKYYKKKSEKPKINEKEITNYLKINVLREARDYFTECIKDLEDEIR